VRAASHGRTTGTAPPHRSAQRRTLSQWRDVKKDENFKVEPGFDWYGHKILVWPITALPNGLSAN